MSAPAIASAAPSSASSPLSRQRSTEPPTPDIAADGFRPLSHSPRSPGQHETDPWALRPSATPSSSSSASSPRLRPPDAGPSRSFGSPRSRRDRSQRGQAPSVGSRGSPPSRPSTASSSSGAASRDRTRYELIVRQQPRKTPAVGLNLGTLARQPIVPAPVVQLIVRDEDGNEISAVNMLDQIPFVFCSAALLPPHGSGPTMDYVDAPGQHGQLQVLIGQLAAEPRQATDLNGGPCVVFVFSDLSIRTEGHFRLRFTLAEALPNSAPLASTVSNAFECVNQSAWTGQDQLLGDTELSRHLGGLGLAVNLP